MWDGKDSNTKTHKNETNNNITNRQSGGDGKTPTNPNKQEQTKQHNHDKSILGDGKWGTAQCV